MATPRVRTAASADATVVAATKSLTFPAPVAAGDLVLTFAAIPLTGQINVGPGVGGGVEGSIKAGTYALLDRSGPAAKPIGALWRSIVTKATDKLTVTVSLPVPSMFLFAGLVIADPGMSVVRVSRMIGEPTGTIRCMQGLVFAAAFGWADKNLPMKITSDLTRIVAEGSNDAGLYYSIRHAPAMIGRNMNHALALPPTTNSGGVMLDMVANPGTNAGLIKGRPTAGLDQELVG